eukprot:TRINITY_DN15479_c0_g1_i1.p1 TRINITY_DN15479_c0_g1~~TRINITY_DN15479_c0_g1_i1.p1  ORF type:complete len:141 (+),score=14.55 TRINITY_DN15479_c0_g1_i1:121-543(+)
MRLPLAAAALHQKRALTVRGRRTGCVATHHGRTHTHLPPHIYVGCGRSNDTEVMVQQPASCEAGTVLSKQPQQYGCDHAQHCPGIKAHRERSSRAAASGGFVQALRTPPAAVLHMATTAQSMQQRSEQHNRMSTHNGTDT